MTCLLLSMNASTDPVEVTVVVVVEEDTAEVAAVAAAATAAAAADMVDEEETIDAVEIAEDDTRLIHNGGISSRICSF